MNIKERVKSCIEQDKNSLIEKINGEYKEQFNENESPNIQKYNEILIYDDFYLTCEETCDSIVFRLQGTVVKNYTELINKLKELELNKID